MAARLPVTSFHFTLVPLKGQYGQLVLADWCPLAPVLEWVGPVKLGASQEAGVCWRQAVLVKSPPVSQLQSKQL